MRRLYAGHFPLQYWLALFSLFALPVFDFPSSCGSSRCEPSSFDTLARPLDDETGFRMPSTLRSPNLHVRTCPAWLCLPVCQQHFTCALDAVLRPPHPSANRSQPNATLHRSLEQFSRLPLIHKHLSVHHAPFFPLLPGYCITSTTGQLNE